MTFDIDVTKSLGSFRIDFRFQAHAVVTALFGHSGSGKTTILNVVAGVLRPDRGFIRVGDEVLFDSRAGIDVPPEKRRCGYIFQDGRLFPHMSVESNLRYGMRGGASSTAFVSFDGAVSLLGIRALLARRPRTLSGGEAQRVAIGRALLSGARFLLMDEPLTFLDEVRREEIFAIVDRLRGELAMPILYVSHDREEIARIGAECVSTG